MKHLNHDDLTEEHWLAVCHHAHTVMFDERPFEYLLGENVRSIPSALIPEPSVKEWNEAGYTIESPPLTTTGTGLFPRLEDRAHTKRKR